MPHITTPGEVQIEYEITGDDHGTPMLLIQGLGAPMHGWRREFCQTLAAQGFRVIRFDNRDCGRSQKFPDGHYLLADMAEDAIGLLDALNISRAHIVGQSLGGMIAQELVLRRPGKAASLCLIYTAPNTGHIRSERDLTAENAQPRARTREEAIEQYLNDESFCASQAYEFDTAWIRELGGLIWDTCYYPEGIPRQLNAIWHSPDRTAALSTVTIPTLIIHGDTDRLIDVSASHALAQALPHATLRIFPGMGHELPAPLWPEIIQAITANTSNHNPARPATPGDPPASTAQDKPAVPPALTGPAVQNDG